MPAWRAEERGGVRERSHALSWVVGGGLLERGAERMLTGLREGEMTKIGAMLMAGCFVATGAIAENGWVCTATGATGFEYRTGEWAPAIYKATGKYVLTKPTSAERALFKNLKTHGLNGSLGGYVVKSVGNEIPLYLDCAQTQMGFYCDDGGFILHREMGRFVISSPMAYLMDPKVGQRYSAKMEIGTCTEF